MNEVLWTDVAPRDGLQNIAETISTEAKIRLVRGLLDAGVPRVEATSFVSPSWVPQLADAPAVLAGLQPELQRLRVLIPNLRGLELALAHGVRNVLVTIAATDSFNRRNVNRTVDESLDEISNIVELAGERACTVDVAVSVSFGCPFEGLVEPARVVELCAELATRGVKEVGLADTIGVATPADVSAMCALAAASLPIERLSLHVHDTRGLGVANVVAAFAAGIRRFDGSVGGVGGCPFAPRSTGNVCTEDALLALHALGAVTGIDLDLMCAVAETLASDLRRDLPGRLYRAGTWSRSPEETPAETSVG
ncbi:MAG TPA: hydroxymethylglutaryl-CoA lyase [Candidatus Saccharimonadales bacterium]|nr:hydroxymethylglutaryl-CoA lyase [Candidatus Saccharimonadales bacterium]